MKRFWPLLEEILNFQRYQGTYNHIVCIGILINPLIKKDHPLFCQARLKSANCPIPYFSLFPSIYWFFVNPLLQTFLVKISQFRNSWLLQQKNGWTLWITYLSPTIYPRSFDVWYMAQKTQSSEHFVVKHPDVERTFTMN